MSVLYRLKVGAFKRPRLNGLWRQWRARHGRPAGDYNRLHDLIREAAPGKSFADIGCMWGVNGAHSFTAEDAGATRVWGVDVFGPTPEFVAAHAARRSRVEFALGDCTAPSTLARIGTVDVVFCAGVLYHHPSPFDVLVALRRMCRETLILRTSTIPEVEGLPNAAVYFPHLSDDARRLWDLRSLGLLHQAGITEPFTPQEGYGNWFWGLTPSCLTSLLETAGFRVERRDNEPFAQTMICTAAAVPFQHRLPGDDEAREVAASISAGGFARPA
jgi:SAM-dependent methyltransferase